jgi:hypothetical protein
MPGAFGKIHTKSLVALTSFGVGLDYLDQEKYDEARDAFQKALDEDPKFDLAEQALVATPVAAMLLMSTSETISGLSSSGISTAAAGSAVVGGVGIGTTAAVVAAIAGGAAAAAGGGGGSSGGGTTTSDGTVAQCNDTQESGGDEVPPPFTIEMGQSSGTFLFTYETRTYPDRIIVSYEGVEKFNTDCVGTQGTRSMEIDYSGSSTQITVEVEPNCDGTTTGTYWEFTVYCPE